MSKERLEEIRDQLEESNSYDDNSNGYWYNAIKWLIEQAERVHELEESIKGHIKVKQVLADKLHDSRRRNKRYREALEFYAEEKNYEFDAFSYGVQLTDAGEVARKALEGDPDD